METPTQNWYASWFGTPYYHILYQNRNDEEAYGFMRNLTRFLNLEPGASILDLACGRGRHSVYLNQLGFDVTGADLSENNISYAKQFENKTLHFTQHDMCEAFSEKNRFDAVFNLFTSFGYFKDPEDNFKTIAAIKKDLKPNGVGVIDFMNVDFVTKNLVPEETIERNGVKFNISRRAENGFIYKKIDVDDKGREFSFTERVKALTLNDFKAYFQKAGMNIQQVFGEYNLTEFDPKNSSRLILIFY